MSELYAVLDAARDRRIYDLGPSGAVSGLPVRNRRRFPHGPQRALFGTGRCLYMV